MTKDATTGIVVYTVQLADQNNSEYITITVNTTSLPVTVTTGNLPNILVSINSLTTISFNVVMVMVVNNGSVWAPGAYNNGDTYEINVNIPVNGGDLGAYYKFTRKNTIQLDMPPTVPFSNLIPPVINPYTVVPIIDILGQTTVNGDYLSDFTFIIQDKVKYYDKCPLKLYKHRGYIEHIVKTCELKTTTFFKTCIPLQDVINGKGKTLSDKVKYVYYKYQPETGLSENDFYGQIILYGMLKYIWSRILYGNFDINYLLRKNNKQFFKDLSHSRFWGFIEFFLNPANNIVGYDKYFKYCIDK